jgi:hypothetical protein
MVERRQEIYQSDIRLVLDDQLKGAVYLSNGPHLPIVWGERLFQVFRGMDASSLKSGHFQEIFQLGSHHFKAVEHLHTTSSDTERRRDSILLHGFVFVGCHMYSGMSLSA